MDAPARHEYSNGPAEPTTRIRTRPRNRRVNSRKAPPNKSWMRPPSTNYCGSHLLSHNHQVAVPSARMGLATGIGTVNRAFPHHYHHRKTNKPHTPKNHWVVVVQEPHSEREHQTCNMHTPQRGANNQIITKNLVSEQNTFSHTPTPQKRVDE